MGGLQICCVVTVLTSLLLGGAAQMCYPSHPVCERNMRKMITKKVISPMLGAYSLCDVVSDGGGWFIFQRRSRVNYGEGFNKNWATFRDGFGSLCKDFWLGNTRLHQITVKWKHTMRITVWYREKVHYAQYTNFRVDSDKYGFRMTFEKYSGDLPNDFEFHNGANFSTYDRDSTKGCPCYYNSGWWFQDCFKVNLNGNFYSNQDSKGVHWEGLTGYNESLQITEMAIRRVI